MLIYYILIIMYQPKIKYQAYNKNINQNHKNTLYHNLNKILQQLLYILLHKKTKIQQSQTIENIIIQKMTTSKYTSKYTSDTLTNFKILKKQYRNGKFIGGMIQDIKNGLGLLVLDNNQIIFGSWQEDNVSGQAVYLSNQLRLFGKIGNNGVLQGFHVIRIMQSVTMENKSRFTKREKSQKLIPMTLYANFKNNKIFGRCVIVIKGQIYTCNAISNQSDVNLQIIKKFINNNRHILQQTLKITFPYIQTFQLHSYLTNMIQNANQNQSLPKILSKYYPKIGKYPTNKGSSDFPDHDNNIFYGFSTHQYQRDHKCNQFGFILYNQEVVSIGDHCEGVPHGLAILYQYDKFIHDGIFQYGKPKGIGVRLQCQQNVNKFRYGQFGTGLSFNALKTYENVKLYQQGMNWPHKIVKQYRKQMHLRSLNFNSNFVEIGINIPKNEIYKICSDILNLSRNQDQTNTKINKTQNKRRKTQMDLPVFLSPRADISEAYKTNYNDNKIKTQKRIFGKQTPKYQSVKYSKDQIHRTPEHKNNISVRQQGSNRQVNINQFQTYKTPSVNNRADLRSQLKSEIHQDFRNKNRKSRANTVSEMLKNFKS